MTTPGTQDVLCTRGRWRSADYKPVRLKRGHPAYLIAVGCTLELGGFVSVRSFSPMAAQPGSLILADEASYSKPELFHQNNSVVLLPKQW